MARARNRLTERKIASLKKTGRYADGGGLYLQISRWETKAWLFKFTLNCRSREMGLGPYPDVSLKEARESARECRAMVRAGVDPIEARKAERAKALADTAKAMTFKECAEDFIRRNAAAWSNVKHGRQWRSTLAAYAYPTIGLLPVSAIETSHVMKILTPIWHEKSETAKRVRGRIESVLDAAAVQGLRSGENPARWRGHLDKLLPKPSKVRAVRHHAALGYAEVGAFMANLQTREGSAARALEFAILTAARTGEVIGAKWDEIDQRSGIWTIPPDRMKGRCEHRVPLSEPALAVLKDMHRLRVNDFIFPGQRGGLSNMAMLQLLKRMGRNDLTIHGFRSSFRDWCAEATGHPHEVVEMALAHAVGNKVEAAYRRGDLFEKRRRLMDDWGEYCGIVEPERGVVLSLFAGGGEK
jgi:integrase